MLQNIVVNPDPDLFGHVGSGSGIIVPDPYPYLIFVTRKSEKYLQVFLLNGAIRL